MRPKTIEYFCVELLTPIKSGSFRRRHGSRDVLVLRWSDPWDNLETTKTFTAASTSGCRPSRQFGAAMVAAEVRALLRLAASRFVDVRDPIQIAYARMPAARAMAMVSLTATAVFTDDFGGRRCCG